MKNLTKILIGSAVLSLILMPSLIFGQGGVTSVTLSPDEQIPTIIKTIIDWAFGLLLVLAAAFIIAAAYYYLAGAGSEESVKTAKNLIIYAVVAIVVAFLARTLVSVVVDLLGTDRPTL